MLRRNQFEEEGAIGETARPGNRGRRATQPRGWTGRGDPAAPPSWDRLDTRRHTFLALTSVNGFGRCCLGYAPRPSAEFEYVSRCACPRAGGLLAACSLNTSSVTSGFVDNPPDTAAISHIQALRERRARRRCRGAEGCIRLRQAVRHARRQARRQGPCGFLRKGAGRRARRSRLLQTALDPGARARPHQPVSRGKEAEAAEAQRRASPPRPRATRAISPSGTASRTTAPMAPTRGTASSARATRPSSPPRTWAPARPRSMRC